MERRCECWTPLQISPLLSSRVGPFRRCGHWDGGEGNGPVLGVCPFQKDVDLLLRHVVPDTAMLSEAALAVAWLTSDEDEAWKGL